MDINAVISLGLGAPADIPHFLLFGLSINADVPDATPVVEVLVAADDREILV